MSSQVPGPRRKPKGKLQFLENHWPSLPAGDFTIDVTQTIASTELPAIDAEGKPVPLVRAFPERTFHAEKREFSVLGPRFSLDPALIRTVFPPAGSLGEHSSVLPHVSFTRSTLPWERQPLPLQESEDDALALAARYKLAEDLEAENLIQPSALREAVATAARNRISQTPEPSEAELKEIHDKKETPWLVLLLFDQNELDEKESLYTHEELQAMTEAALGRIAAGLEIAAETEEQNRAVADHKTLDNEGLVTAICQVLKINTTRTKPAIVRTCVLEGLHDGEGEPLFALRAAADKALERSEFGGEGVLSPSFSGEKGQQTGDPVMTLEVERSLLEKILPSVEDARWLAHARRATDESDKPISDELATLFCNRLPRPDRTSIVHLVSLEGGYWGQSDNQDLWKTVAEPSAPDNERIRLVSLKSWRFACVAEEHSFKGLLRSLDYGIRRFPSGKVGVPSEGEPIETSTTLRLPDEGFVNAGPYLHRGYVAVPHQMRDGNRSVSWFHGPLAPGEAVNTSRAGPERRQLKDGILPARSADQLVRYFPDCGMFDVSYAAAWELGRLLMLANRSVAIDLLDWKRRHRHVQEQAAARRELVHLPIEGQRADAGFPEKVTSWFRGVSLLKGVPFNYLVPDERMLPQESLRFFWLDAAWVRCLLDGAFSIGRVLPSDFARDRAHEKDPRAFPHAIVTGFLLRSQVVSGWPDLQVDGYDERVDDDDYERPELKVMPPIRSLVSFETAAEASELARRLDAGDAAAARENFGFRPGKDLLLGSYEPDASLPMEGQTRPPAWVANVNENQEIYLIRRHDRQFTVKLENKLHLLRMARLSENVLLCLFAGDVKTVDIHQRPEALHFGLNRTEDDPPDYYRELKSRTGGELSGVEIPMIWKDEVHRVVSIAELAGAIDGEFQSLGNDGFAGLVRSVQERFAKLRENLKQGEGKECEELLRREREEVALLEGLELQLKKEHETLVSTPGYTGTDSPDEFIRDFISLGNFTSAQFALQLVEGVQKVRFRHVD